MVIKVHTRVRRYLPSSRHGRNRASRPKTFSSEDAAIAWAKQQKIEGYELVNLKAEGAKVKKIRLLPLAPVK